MPDITMCNGFDCKVKDKCYRHTAKPNEVRQSYFSDSPIKDGKCLYQVDNKGRDNV